MIKTSNSLFAKAIDYQITFDNLFEGSDGKRTLNDSLLYKKTFATPLKIMETEVLPILEKIKNSKKSKTV